MNKIKFSGFLISIVLLSACGANAPPPTVVTNTPLPTSTSNPTNTPNPTPTPNPTSTPVPTFTVAPATKTALPPTATPVPTKSEPRKAHAPDLVLTLAPNVEMAFVRVPAGDFLMGSADSDGDAQVVEMPQTKVFLDEFLIGKYEVTNAQFAAFVKATGYKTSAEKNGSGYVYKGGWTEVKGADWQHPRGPESNLQGLNDYPAVLTSWDDAVAFCAWAGRAAGGRKIKLPSEAQWEKAARGTDGISYPWGNDLQAGIDTKNVDPFSSALEIVKVGQSSPRTDSPYGAADMAGNAWEWTSSLSAPYPYKADDGREDASSRGVRVTRGGSAYLPLIVRVAGRDKSSPDYGTSTLSFRVIVLPK